MSRPNIRRRRVEKDSSLDNQIPADHIPYDSPRKRQKRGVIYPSIYLSDGQRFTQRHGRLPHGQVGLQDPWPSDYPSRSNVNRIREPEEPPPLTIMTPTTSLHHRKRVAQNLRWQSDVIPKLIRPFLALVRETKNLTIEPSFMERVCGCLEVGRTLSIVLVRVLSESILHPFSSL